MVGLEILVKAGTVDQTEATVAVGPEVLVVCQR